MQLLGIGIVMIVVGVIFAAASVWMYPRVASSESFIGEFFGGLLWAALVTCGATGIVLGVAMIWAWTDGAQTLHQLI